MQYCKKWYNAGVVVPACIQYLLDADNPFLTDYEAKEDMSTFVPAPIAVFDSSKESFLPDINGTRGDWILLDDGAMRGMNVIVDQTTEEIVSLSTRNCRDVDRWKEGMPSLNANFHSLQTLDLDNSRYLVGLHPTVGSLSNLRRLILTRCDRLERLPDSICSLNNLQEVRKMLQ